MSNDLPGIDRAKLEELKAEADAAMAEDAADAAEESPRARRAREEAAKAASVAKWNKKLSETAARNRGRPTEADDALQGDDARPEQPPEPEAIDPPQPPPATSESPEPAKATAADRRAKGKRTRKRKPEPEAPKVDALALSAQLTTTRPWSDAAAALLSRIVYAQHHDGAECPQQRIMTYLDPHDWWEGLPPDERRRLGAKVTEILRGLIAQRDGRLWLVEAMAADGHNLAGFLDAPVHDGANGRPYLDPDTGDELTLAQMIVHTIMPTPVLGLPEAPVHELWCVCPQRGRHPLAPIVADWQEHAPVSVELDRHPRGILPATLRDVHRDQAVLPLALDRSTPLGSTPLGPAPDREAGYLPGLEPAPSLVPAVPWLTLYDLTGIGPVQTRGRGAPLVQRLFVEVLTAVPRAGREWTAELSVTLHDLFNWLWPRYVEADRMRGGYDRSKHLLPLVRALVELDNMRLVLPGDPAKLARRLIRVDDLPTAGTALDDVIRFHVRHLPGGSDHGPMFDRAPARRRGLVSAPAWRSTIRLAYVWDAAKARNGGARIYASRPRFDRGPDGVLLGVDGRPLRDRRGALVSNWRDPRAVPLGADGHPAGPNNPPAFERNPAADRVPLLGPDDLRRLAFDEDLDTNRRDRLYGARRALATMETAGEIVREPDGHGGERIIEARPADPDRWRH